jgi:hypothetical protein
MAGKKGTKPDTKPEFVIFGNAEDSKEELVEAFGRWVDEIKARLLEKEKAQGGGEQEKEVGAQ